MDDRLLKKRDAAAFCCLGLSTFERYVSAGYVPRPVAFGNVLRWRLSELRAWLEAGCPREARSATR